MTATDVDVLLAHLKEFLSDPAHAHYALNRNDAALILETVERYRPVPLLSFREIKEAADRKRAGG